MVWEVLEAFNFQRHVATRVEFDPVATCLIAPTNRGKSALVRLLRWINLNQPTGVALTRMRPLRIGADFVKGRLTLDGGHTVVRRRGKMGNHYLLDGRLFEAFSTGVPAEISQLLDVGEVNFVGQHDAVYLFSDTPGVVSRALNGIIDLDQIDRMLDGVGTRVRVARSAVATATGRHTQAQQQVDALTWVPRMDAALRTVEVQQQQAQEAAQTAIRLSQVVRTAREAGQRHATLQQISQAIGKVVAIWQKVARLRTRRSRLTTSIDKVNEAQAMHGYRLPDAQPLETAWRNTAAAQVRTQRLADQIHRVRQALTDRNRRHEGACNAAQRLSTTKTRLGICPVCGNSLGSASSS